MPGMDIDVLKKSPGSKADVQIEPPEKVIVFSILLTDSFHWLQRLSARDFQQRRELGKGAKKGLGSSCRGQCCTFKRQG